MKLEEIIAKILTIPVILLGVYVFLLSYHQTNIIIRWIYYIMAGILWIFSITVLISKIEGFTKETEKRKIHDEGKEVKGKSKQ